jgi:hypothetical protein
LTLYLSYCKYTEFACFLTLKKVIEMFGTNDAVVGGSANDTISYTSDTERDTISGSAGDDTIFGAGVTEVNDCTDQQWFRLQVHKDGKQEEDQPPGSHVQRWVGQQQKASKEGSRECP